MSLSIHAIELCKDIPDCMTVEEIKLATLDDEHLAMLSEYVLCGWPVTKAELQMKLQPFRSLGHEIVIIDRIAVKGRRILVPASLHKVMKPAAHESYGHRKN